MIETTGIYKFLSKRLTGHVLKLFFGNEENKYPSKVLELIDVVAFIDFLNYGQGRLYIEIGDCGSYGFDLVGKLDRKEIVHFKEVFLSEEANATNTKFRAIGRKIIWRDFDNEINGDINY